MPQLSLNRRRQPPQFEQCLQNPDAKNDPDPPVACRMNEHVAQRNRQGVLAFDDLGIFIFVSVAAPAAPKVTLNEMGRRMSNSTAFFFATRRADALLSFNSEEMSHNASPDEQRGSLSARW